jgi:hypothetical protein
VASIPNPIPADEVGPDPFVDLHLRLRFGPHQSPRFRDWRLAEHALLRQQLGALDDRLERLALRRRWMVVRLGEVRDTLWPAWPGAGSGRVRRPSSFDDPPLPPPVPGAEPLHGPALRGTCLVVLSRSGPMSLRELHAQLHLLGYRVGSARPVQRLGDAMAFEVRAGRARRLARGVYDTAPLAGPVDDSGVGAPLPWSDVPGDGPDGVPVDPLLREVPERWQPHPWDVPDDADEPPESAKVLSEFVKAYALDRQRRGKKLFRDPRLFTPRSLGGDSSANRRVAGGKWQDGGGQGPPAGAPGAGGEPGRG